jgi:hypothetical protein
MSPNKSWLAGLIVSTTLLFSACSFLETMKAPNDQAITSEIQSKLFADSSLKARDIRVTAEKGVVTLAGTVETELEKAAAENLAAQSKGVKRVVNQLMVGTASATMMPMPAAEPAPEPPAAAKPARPVAKAPARETEFAQATPAPAPAAPAAREAADSVVAAPPAQPAPPPPVEITIPAGTVITVRMIDGIDSAINKPGEEFAASVDAPVVVGDKIVVRKGADARVRLVQAKSAGRMTGQSELEVELVGLALGNQTFAVESSAYEKAGASRGKRTAATIGGGAALGGLIGAVAGKGKGAAIGAAVGAGAGTAVQAATKGQQVQIPSETKLDFALKAPITFTM